MSTWTELRRELRETEITDREWTALRRVLEGGFKQGLPANADIELPSVTAAGKPYLLRIPTDASGKPTKIEVDLSPDLSSPAFDAYTDFRNDPTAGTRLSLTPTNQTTEGEDG